MPLQLTPIQQDGETVARLALDDHLRMVIAMTVRHYEQVGFVPPWFAYIAVENSKPVGTCAFKSPPVEGRVEIAYATLPGYEGRGVATAMATELLRIARQADDRLAIFAQTLPAENASTAILQKLGFRLLGAVEHPEDGLVWEWELPPKSTWP